MAFAIDSPVFPHGGPIPAKYTGDGDDVSPPLRWRDPPSGTRSFALVVVDPDAPRGVFRHWVVYDIDAGHTHLPEAVKAHDLPQGVNDVGYAHYVGPNPPHGHGTHHYHFQLMALDVDHLRLPARPTVEDLREAAKAHLLGEAEIIGTYTH
jgi:Raf kinase inhibitor-like YbhB/YbcL family protein